MPPNLLVISRCDCNIFCKKKWKFGKWKFFRKDRLNLNVWNKRVLLIKNVIDKNSCWKNVIAFITIYILMMFFNKCFSLKVFSSSCMKLLINLIFTLLIHIILVFFWTKTKILRPIAFQLLLQIENRIFFAFDIWRIFEGKSGLFLFSCV